MTIQGRTLFLILVILLGIWFAFAERAVLTPFIVAGVFAYLFNPVISFVSKKTKLSRTLTIIIIYVFITGLLAFGALKLSSQIFEEYSDLKLFATHNLQHASSQLSALPDWARPTARQLLAELEKSRYIALFNSDSLFPFVSQAISRIISFFIFFFSGYYFLKDGGKMYEKFKDMLPIKDRNIVDKLSEEISVVLSKYLRGQVFLIFLMGVATYIALAIVGVQYAVSIAVFSGIAEIVPVIGPIAAGAVAASAVLITGHAHFGLSPVNAAFTVVVIYFVLRQLEDYFVIPYVMGSITQLPPLVIFFAVVLGGNIAGIVGLILAVPTAAIFRMFWNFFQKQKMVQGSE